MTLERTREVTALGKVFLGSREYPYIDKTSSAGTVKFVILVKDGEHRELIDDRGVRSVYKAVPIYRTEFLVIPLNCSIYAWTYLEKDVYIVREE